MRFAAIVAALALLLAGGVQVAAAPSFTGPAVADAVIVRPGAVARAAGLDQGAPGPVRIARLGDSFVGGHPGDNGDISTGLGAELDARLRLSGRSIQWVGNYMNVRSPLGSAVQFEDEHAVWHCGYAGDTVAQILSRWTSSCLPAITAGGALPPDVVILDGGWNDMGAGASASTTLGRLSGLIDQVAADVPRAYVVVTDGPSAQQGAPWSTYNGGLPGIVATSTATGRARGSRVVHCPIYATLTAADFTAGHPSATGRATAADALALCMTRSVLPAPQGVPSTLGYQPIAQQDALTFTGAYNDYTGWAPNANTYLEVGANSFWFAIQFYPTSLPAGAHTIYSDGLDQSAGGLALVQSAGTLSVYFASAGSALLNAYLLPVFPAVNRWYDILVVGDRAAGTVAVWVNGKLAGWQSDLGQWTLTTGRYILIGSSTGAPSVIGQLRRVAFGRGAAVPALPTGATPDAWSRIVTTWHLAGALPPGAVAAYPLGDCSTVDAGLPTGFASTIVGPPNAGAPGSFAGGTSVTCASPSAASPWDGPGL